MDLSRYISPIVTSVLMGSVLWVVDSIIFALGMTGVSIGGALYAEVSVLRLSLRVLAFLVCLFCGVYAGYKASVKASADLHSFEADKLFTDENYLRESEDTGFSGDDTLRGFSYVESVTKNPDVDVVNRPIYFSEHIKRSLCSKTTDGHVSQKTHRLSENLLVERFGAIQQTESQLLWQYSARLGSALKLDVAELSAIRTLCYAYNIGLFVDGSTYENHGDFGAEIIVEIPELAAAAPLIATHHEKWDGSGILQLSGLDIPLGSRIFAVAWVYNAFTKPYGAWRLSTEDALDMLQMYAGTALDPELVAVFTGMLRQRSLMNDGMVERATLRQIG